MSGRARRVTVNKLQYPSAETVQESVDDAFRKVVGMPVNEARIIEIDFNDGLTQTIKHGLSGACRGFIVMDMRNTFASIVRSDVDNERLRDTHIKITASSAINAIIMVWR